MNTVDGTLFLFCVLYTLGETNVAKDTYWMDDASDCDPLTLQEVPNDFSVWVHARRSGISPFIACSIQFRSVNASASLMVAVHSFQIDDCRVRLQLVGDNISTTFNCNTTDEEDVKSFGRNVNLILEGDSTSRNYNFSLIVAAEPPSPTVTDDFPKDDPSSPGLSVGAIVGIVAGIVLFLVVVIVLLLVIKNSKLLSKDRDNKYEENPMTSQTSKHDERTLSYDNPAMEDTSQYYENVAMSGQKMGPNSVNGSGNLPKISGYDTHI